MSPCSRHCLNLLRRSEKLLRIDWLARLHGKIAQEYALRVQYSMREDKVPNAVTYSKSCHVRGYFAALKR